MERQRLASRCPATIRRGDPCWRWRPIKRRQRIVALRRPRRPASTAGTAPPGPPFPSSRTCTPSPSATSAPAPRSTPAATFTRRRRHRGVERRPAGTAFPSLPSAMRTEVFGAALAIWNDGGGNAALRRWLLRNGGRRPLQPPRQMDRLGLGSGGRWRRTMASFSVAARLRPKLCVGGAFDAVGGGVAGTYRRSPPGRVSAGQSLGGGLVDEVARSTFLVVHNDGGGNAVYAGGLFHVEDGAPADQPGQMERQRLVGGWRRGRRPDLPCRLDSRSGAPGRRHVRQGRWRRCQQHRPFQRRRVVGLHRQAGRPGPRRRRQPPGGARRRRRPRRFMPAAASSSPAITSSITLAKLDDGRLDPTVGNSNGRVAGRPASTPATARRSTSRAAPPPPCRPGSSTASKTACGAAARRWFRASTPCCSTTAAASSFISAPKVSQAPALPARSPASTAAPGRRSAPGCSGGWMRWPFSTTATVRPYAGGNILEPAAAPPIGYLANGTAAPGPAVGGGMNDWVQAGGVERRSTPPAASPRPAAPRAAHFAVERQRVDRGRWRLHRRQRLDRRYWSPSTTAPGSAPALLGGFGENGAPRTTHLARWDGAVWSTRRPARERPDEGP